MSKDPILNADHRCDGKPFRLEDFFSTLLAVRLGQKPRARSMILNIQTCISSEEAEPSEVRSADMAARHLRRILYAFLPGMRVAKNARLNIDYDCFLMTARHVAAASLAGTDRSRWK